MVNYHRKQKTWRDKVDQFIALTEFAKGKFVQARFPENKITVKPNFINCDVTSRRPGKEKAFALFVGRLSEEKGVEVMIGAWERLSGISLKIVGDGPLGPFVANCAGSSPDIEWLGNRSRSEVMTLMKEATLLVFPSTCYEGLPMTILEAFASGLPVIASGHGSMSTLIAHQHTGLHFRPGDPGDLAEKVKWAFSHAAEVNEMGSNAQNEFAKKYTASQNYRMLVSIYESAIRNRDLNSR